jgi:hypothetical protein
MPQPIQNTDAYVMMQLGADLKPFVGKQMTHELQQQLKAAARPHADRLLRNGHSKADAVSLVAAVWKSLQ